MDPYRWSAHRPTGPTRKQSLWWALSWRYSGVGFTWTRQIGAITALKPIKRVKDPIAPHMLGPGKPKPLTLNRTRAKRAIQLYERYIGAILGPIGVIIMENQMEKKMENEMETGFI